METWWIHFWTKIQALYIHKPKAWYCVTREMTYSCFVSTYYGSNMLHYWSWNWVYMVSVWLHCLLHDSWPILNPNGFVCNLMWINRMCIKDKNKTVIHQFSEKQWGIIIGEKPWSCTYTKWKLNPKDLVTVNTYKSKLQP